MKVFPEDPNMHLYNKHKEEEKSKILHIAWLTM
jgi:hypothetical protein